MDAEGSGPAAREAALLAENQQLRRHLAEAKLLATHATTETAAAAEGQRAALVASQRETAGARQEARQARIEGAQAVSNHRAAAVAVRAELAGSEALNAALQASEGRLRLVLESATDFAIVTTDLDGHLTGWNIGARNILGWDEAEALGRDARMIWTPEDRAAGVPEAEMRCARERGRATDERWHLRRDGSRFWASGEMMPLRGGGRDPSWLSQDPARPHRAAAGRGSAARERGAAARVGRHARPRGRDGARSGRYDPLLVAGLRAPLRLDGRGGDGPERP